MTAHIQFSHANGFPAAVYQPLLSKLDAEVQAIPVIGNEQYPLSGGFDVLADQLINEVEGRVAQSGQKVIGVGHSLGAVLSLIAAGKRPDLFSDVILMDPVIFNPAKVLMINVLRELGLIDRFGPSGGAMRRKAVFSTRDEAAERWITRQPYVSLCPEVFDLVIEHCLYPEGDHFRLVIPPEQEAAIFRHAINALRPELRKVKGTVMFPLDSHFLRTSDRKFAALALKQINQIHTAGGHMWPLSHPNQAAEMINQLLSA